MSDNDFNNTSTVYERPYDESILVSIVIPSYNRAHMLSTAIEACLTQTYKNIEVIVVNDGSTDNTLDVLNKYADTDQRVKVFNKENEGIADTLNYGFERTVGEYVTWTSDDNYYYPEAIGSLVGFLKTHPNIGMVYSDVRNIDAEDKPIGIVNAGGPELLETYCHIHGCHLYRREVMKKVGKYRREWVRCQDHDYYIRIYKDFKIAHLPKVLYDYRWHEESMSGDHESHVLEEARLFEFHAKNRIEKRKIWAKKFGYLGCWFEIRWRFWKAFYYYSRAVPYEPGRIRDAIRAFFIAVYNSIPERVKETWRGLKKRFFTP